MAAKRKARKHSSLRWIITPIALALALGAWFALLRGSPPPASQRASVSSPSDQRQGNGRDEIDEASRDQLREILRAADEDDSK